MTERYKKRLIEQAKEIIELRKNAKDYDIYEEKLDLLLGYILALEEI